jgi:AcrR family transcriptional regulator
MDSPLTPRQQEILAASLTVIDREGLKRFTMKNVAQEIGVTDAALYKHFPDKAAILQALATLFKENTLDILVAIRNDAALDALGKLEVFIKGRARQFQDNRALTVTLFSDELFRGVLAISSLNQDTMDSHAQHLAAILKEGQDDGTIRRDIPPEHLVMLLMGPMRLMVTAWKSDSAGAPNLVDRVDRFWETLSKILGS